MSTPFEFDTSNYEPIQEFQPIPAGWYTAAIINTEVKDNKAATGRYLEVTFTILDEGQHKGRQIIERLSFDNPNQVAVDIATRAITSIVGACGFTKIQTSDQLHGIPIEVKVGVVPAKGEYPPSNKIKNYRASGGGPTGSVPNRPVTGNVMPQPNQAQASSLAPDQPPW